MEFINSGLSLLSWENGREELEKAYLIRAVGEQKRKFYKILLFLEGVIDSVDKHRAEITEKFKSRIYSMVAGQQPIFEASGQHKTENNLSATK